MEFQGPKDKQDNCLFCHPENKEYRAFGIGLRIIQFEDLYYVENMAGEFEDWTSIEFCPKCGRYLKPEFQCIGEIDD